MKHKEYELQVTVCNYLALQYPGVMFMSDTIAAVKLNVRQAARNKAIQKQGFKCPDLIILEPRGGFYGLFIELKTETPYKLNGELKASDEQRIKAQGRAIDKLNGKGYLASFAWTFEQAKKMIDFYMSGCNGEYPLPYPPKKFAK